MRNLALFVQLYFGFCRFTALVVMLPRHESLVICHQSPSEVRTSILEKRHTDASLLCFWLRQLSTMDRCRP